jgi:hypothetical protein
MCHYKHWVYEDYLYVELIENLFVMLNYSVFKLSAHVNPMLNSYVVFRLHIIHWDYLITKT